MESVRDRCNGRGPWFLVLDCAPQHILLLVGAVCPNCFHHDLHCNNCGLHSGGYAAAHHVLDSCARAQMSFSTYRSGGNLVFNLFFSISVLRQLLLSFVRIVA